MMETEHILSFPELPHYLTVVAVMDEDIVKVLVRSTIHVNKEVKLPTQYSIRYARECHGSMKAEVLSQVVDRYGLRLQPPKYE